MKIDVRVPDEVMVEAGLLFYDTKQLIVELHRRQVSEDEIRGMLYALDQIADHRTNDEPVHD